MIEIIKPGTHIDFIGKWRIAALCSALLIAAGLAAIPIMGFRLGIDFAGGTEVHVRFDTGSTVDEAAVRSVIEQVGVPNASVLRYGTGDVPEFLVKFRGGRSIGGSGGAAAVADADSVEAATVDAEGDAADGSITEKNDRILAIESALEREIGALTIERVEFVGPKVGAELREDGLKAMGIACLLILAYIAFRFTTRFAPGAVVALVHDVLVTSSLWVLLGLEFDLRVLAALLAIIGYSLNDTIIVYDRIRENLELHTNVELEDVLNRSVNQTLSRTLLTSLTTLAAVLALLFLGGAVIWPFALAMAIGIVVGTYSSIFIAAPTLLLLQDRGAKGRDTARPKPGKPKAKPKRQRKPARA